MIQFIFSYLHTAWGISVTMLLILGFGAKSYDVFVKVWPAVTGKFTTKGKITWPEFRPQPKWLKHHDNEGIISYSYHIEGQLFNGTVPPGKLTKDYVEKNYFKGAEVDVFYSPRLPEYSFVTEPPTQSVVAMRVLSKWFFGPVLLLSTISIFIWFLATAGV